MILQEAILRHCPFVSDKNTKIGLVQFVMKTEGIKLPEKEKAETVEEPLTFWQRLVKLFKSNEKTREEFDKFSVKSARSGNEFIRMALRYALEHLEFVPEGDEA